MPGCIDPSHEWGCEAVHDPANVVGSNTAIAFEPGAGGAAWISFRDQDAGALMVARFGSSEPPCTNTAWECTVVDIGDGHDVGFETDIAFDSDGVAWVSYQDTTTDDLKVAHETPGTPADAGCAAGWTCELIDAATQVGGYSAIAIVEGSPLVTYWDAGNNDLRYARYVGAGGTACRVEAWDCGIVDSGPVGAFANDLEVRVDAGGATVFAAYRYTGQGRGPNAAKLVVASYPGDGTGCGAGQQWTCTPVTQTGNVGLDPGIAVDPSGNPWVHYWTNNNLNLARFVGNAAGDCTENTDWECEKIHDEAASVGEYGDIAFAGETAWIAYYGRGDQNAYIAQYVGDGTGVGCGSGGSSDWSCSVLDQEGDVGRFWMGIAVDTEGFPWISYHDATNGTLKVAAPRTTDTAPSVSIAGPSEGSTIAGTVTVQVDATDAEDPAGILTVEVAIDGGAWQPAVYNPTTGYYELAWDTTAVGDGSHPIDARATDRAGNTASATPVTVAVDNIDDAPSVSTASPADGSTVSGTATIQVDATDDRDAQGSLTVEVAIDGGAWQPAVYNPTTGYYELAWDTTAVGDGSHPIDARATDRGANTAHASRVAVTVDNTTSGTVIVDEITYATQGGPNNDRHLLVTVTLLDGLGSKVAGASVSIDLLRDGSLYDSFSDATVADGTVNFRAKNALSGCYETSATEVVADGLIWDGATPPNGFCK